MKFYIWYTKDETGTYYMAFTFSVDGERVTGDWMRSEASAIRSLFRVIGESKNIEKILSWKPSTRIHYENP